MAKRRKRKALNMKLRLRGQRGAAKGRDFAALALALHFRDGSHGDARKEASRKACRGQVSV